MILKLINIVSVIMIAGLYFNHSQTLGFDVDIIRDSLEIGLKLITN